MGITDQTSQSSLFIGILPKMGTHCIPPQGEMYFYWMNILLIGSTGLVGSEVLKLLSSVDRIAQVICPVRKMRHHEEYCAKAAFCEVSLADVDLWYPLTPMDAIICTLGTTIKAAGSQEEFRKIDLELVLSIAKIAQQKGVPRMLVVSAMGANTHSKVFYNRVKGELEAELQALTFPFLTIVRPSLLLGHRDKFRPGEWLAQKLMGPLRKHIPAKWRPVTAQEVALSLVTQIFRTEPGHQILENSAILRAS